MKKRYYYVVGRAGRDFNVRYLVITLPDGSGLDEIVSAGLQGLNMTSHLIHGYGSLLDTPGMEKSIKSVKMKVASPKIIKLFKKEVVKSLGE